jgi:uncharacterized protein YhbP (UPF0306 family)
MKMDIEKIIRDYLTQVIHLSLATSKDNRPWVCEAHFAFDEDLNLYYRSLSTRRHSLEIAENPNVAGNIIKQHPLDTYPLGVYFEGAAKLLDEPGDEQTKAFQCLKKRLLVEDSILEEAKRPDGHKFYKITIENWYVFGKFGGQPGQKYKLEWNGGKK